MADAPDNEDNLCECGRDKQDCAKYDDESVQHGDRDEEQEPDEEFMERKRIVEEVSRRVGGLTSSEVNDIMNDY